MTAVCFGCGGRFERAQLEDVGDTVFCRACLARMLRRVDERDARLPPRAEPPAPSAAVSAMPPADAPCFICGHPLEGEAFVELRGFAICTACSRGLVGGDDLPAASAANDDRPAEPRGPRDVLRGPALDTPGTGTEWCSRCGRAMPGPGSYQLVDGRPHCAACIATRAAESVPPPPLPPPSPSPSPGEPATLRVVPATCDACLRAVATVRETRGFALCLACLDSDATLALALAQAHHRRRLERASRRILEGEDE